MTNGASVGRSGGGGSESFAEEGFCVLPAFVAEAMCRELEGALEAVLRSRDADAPARASSNLRNLLRDLPSVRSLARGAALGAVVQRCLGGSGFPVRALLFDKTPAANWAVSWHQDVTIAVRERREVEGFTGWSVKDGVPHVHPPVEVLRNMVAVRVHLDDCPAANGALQVIPGSHRQGKLEDTQIGQWRAAVPPVTCAVAWGGVLVMRPLLLHASARAAQPGRRRVIHIEYASAPLPGGLEWFEASA